MMRTRASARLGTALVVIIAAAAGQAGMPVAYADPGGGRVPPTATAAATTVGTAAGQVTATAAGTATATATGVGVGAAGSGGDRGVGGDGLGDQGTAAAAGKPTGQAVPDAYQR